MSSGPPMNILLINHYAGSPAHGMEYRPYYLAREWVRSGHRVVVAASSVSHVRTNPPAMVGRVGREEIDGIGYLWLKTPSYRGNDARRVLNILAFTARLYRSDRHWPAGFRPDIVIASSTYPLDNVPARALARRYRAKLVYEVHDLWPLSPVEIGNMSRRHPFILLMQAAENYACRHADIAVSLLPLAEGHMRSHGLAPGKFHYVPNGVDVEEWDRSGAGLPEAHERSVQRLRDDGRFIVGYAGAHGMANALELVLEAAQRLRGEPVSFLLVGSGPEKERLRTLAARMGLSNVEFLPAVAKRSVPRLLSLMDALIITLRPSTLFRFGISPNKLMDYMMAGKPVIQAIDAGNDMVGECGCGVPVRGGEPAAIAAAVRTIMAMGPDERRAMGLRGREYVRANHDYRVLAERFLRACTGPGGPPPA